MTKAPRKGRKTASSGPDTVSDTVPGTALVTTGSSGLAIREETPAASVAICTFQRYDLLEGVLRATAAQATGPGACAQPFEILLIDNTPDPDRSFVEYRRHRATPFLRWIHEPQKGLSHARNRAIAEARAPIIAFLDDDAMPGEGWLAEMLAAFARLGPDACVIGGRVTPVWLGPRPAWLADEMLQYLSITDLGEELRVLRESEWIVGANMAMRRSVFDRAGLFPVHLGRKGGGATLLSNDETALMRDIRAVGGLIGYAPRAAAGHLIDPSRLSQGWFRRRLAWQAVSDYLEGEGAGQVSADRNWDWLTGFLAGLPASQRSYRGLLADMPTAELFEQQLGAVYNAMACLLSGAALSEQDSLPPSRLGQP